MIGAAVCALLTLFAHQGGAHPGVVPNTMPNFALAASPNWETDVRWTSTGYPVLLHDGDLRLFGCPTVKIKDVSVAKARQCKASNGQTISTLAQFASALPGRAWIELKVAPTKAQWVTLASRLDPIRDRVVIESFSLTTVAAATAHGYETALLTGTATKTLPAGTDWYAPASATLTQAQLDWMHLHGYRVAVWTVTSSPLAVDAVIGD